MAERWTIAFGRYLRTLRERRGLSLDDVESFSEAFPDPVRKAYLSKCENGHQSLAFSKLVALCRIYEVPPEVLTERLQLDMELEKTDPPSVDGRTFSSSTDEALSALHRGQNWEAYALLRDALPRAKTDPIRDGYRDHAEQTTRGHMNCATVALRLGRLHYALHEYKYVASSDALDSQQSAISMERLAECYRRLGDLDKSREVAEKAVALAEEVQDQYALGYCYAMRALIAADDGDPSLAGEFYERAYTAYKHADIRYECVRTLSNLAQCYFDTHRFRAARRALGESQRIAVDLGYKRSEAVANILLGMIDFQENKEQSALRRLRRAAETAESLNDRVLWFKAEFQLYKHAIRTGPKSEAHRLRQQLSQLQAWIPADTSELAEFRRISQ